MDRISLSKFLQIDYKNEERIGHDVTHIQHWMEKQPHLDFSIGNELVLSFLRCSKFSLERTKEKIDNYYTQRTLSPDVFANRDPLLPEIQRLLNKGIILPLPKTGGSNGPRIIWSSCNEILDPDTMSLKDVAKLLYMIMDILLIEDKYVTINGLTSVVNCKNANAKYGLQLTPPFIKRHIHIIEGGYPFRISGLYIVNLPSIFKYIYDLAKGFFSKKMSERIRVYTESNFPEICEIIPQHLLPEEYGGENGSIKELTITWKNRVESYRDWFLRDENLKSNENLRCGASKPFSNDFGMEGSFKQLNID